MSEAPTYEQFLEVHEPQLLTSAVPDRFWPALHRKLAAEELDAGESFQIIVEQDEEGETQSFSVRAIREVSADDPENIFLIDHAWTFRPNSARAALREVAGLKERLMDSFGIKPEDLTDADSVSDYIGSESGDARPREERPKGGEEDVDSDRSSAPSVAELDAKLVDALLRRLWAHAQTYTVKVRKSVVDESDMPVWYVPDEFGLRIGHSATPNTRMVPFFYAFQNAAYSLLFPLQTIGEDEEVTRNYVAPALLNTHPDWADVLLLPWAPADFSARPIEFSPKDASFFLDGRVPDQLPAGPQPPPADPNGVMDTIRLFAPDGQLAPNLKSTAFELVDDLYKADVIWTREHFHDFAALAERNPNGLINQFPFESALTVKDLFAACVQAVPDFAASFDEERLEWAPAWFPATFNLNEELPAFVSYFQRRQQRGLDCSFIVKPWNLARGLDTFVTDSLDCIVRMAESGPKLVSKYVENPVLFRRPDNGRLVKFDLRFIVFLRSVEPLDVHVYKHFWPRCAINDYDLQTLDDIFAHLSVHNYGQKEQVLNIRDEEFLDHLSKLHPQIHWPVVQEKIDVVIREVFQTPDQKDVDVVFIEANFTPDCERAAQFYPVFFDSVLQTLFLGGGSDKTRRL
ncbi:hypothetical protein M3Y99_00735800 [Aphelenchoides fujianensis]|nr:hypothetical protein M3Y99_00735800 [Aphelenchoides fujianensis]